MQLAAASMTLAAEAPSLTWPQLIAATPKQRADMILAALPATALKLRSREVAHPLALTIDANADGWFVRADVYEAPTQVPDLALCERRMVIATLRPDQGQEYPMSKESVTTKPLHIYWTGKESSYWRRSGVTPREKCPLERDAPYTVAPDAATAARVFDALDGAVYALEKDTLSIALRCGTRDGPRPCADGLGKLRSVEQHVSAIHPQSPSPAQPNRTSYAVNGKQWSATIHLDSDRIAAIVILPTPSPPIS